jgi:hypothetical protein
MFDRGDSSLEYLIEETAALNVDLECLIEETAALSV